MIRLMGWEQNLKSPSLARLEIFKGGEMIKVNLLLVDDEQEVLDEWKNHFSSEMFNIFEATTGEVGLQLVEKIRKEKKPAFLIVLLDVRMPGLDGLHVLEGIKDRVPFAKIFIITGNIEVQNIADTAYLTGKFGGDGFFEKSKIDFNELKKQIENFLKEERNKLSKVKNIKNALEELVPKVDINLPYDM